MSAAESVVGGIIIGGTEAYWRVADLIEPEDLPTPKLVSVYRLLAQMVRAGSEIDMVTAAEAAEAAGVCRGDEVIGLASATHSASNIRAYAEQVKSASVRRRVQAICAEGAKTGDLATVQAKLTSLLSAQPAHAVHASEALSRMWDDVMARYERGEELAGLPTGFPKIDEMTGGLQAGRVYGIGARAKMGKTVLAMNICANLALAGTPVVAFSLEMSAEELMQRMTCAVSGVESVFLQRPKLLDSRDSATSLLKSAVQRLREAPLHIADRTDVTIEEIEAQARQMHAMGNCDALAIDYLGLIRTPKAARHEPATAHITRRVKILAKERRIPVLLVFQLTRGSESGAAVRPPRPSDARDSGAIEQDLDAMFLLHRPSYYDKTAEAGLR